MKYGSISTPLSIPTIWTPLSASLKITHEQPLQQWYYDSLSAYIPSRNEIPLLLTPELNAVDTETGTVYTLSELLNYTVDGVSIPKANIKWYIRASRDIDSWVQIQGDHDMFVASNGILNIRGNIINAGDSKAIRCIVEWEDIRNGEAHVDNAEVVLTCMGIGESPMVLTLLSPSVVRWNPLSSASSIKRVTAEVRMGGEPITENVTYQWYKVKGDNSRVLIDDDAALCAAYVSGQGTNTLAMDLDYLTSLTVECRFSISGVQMPDRKQVRFMWNIPTFSCDVYTPQGESIRETSAEQMEFRSLIKSNGVDMFREIVEGVKSISINDKLSLFWYYKSSHEDNKTLIGTGPEITAETSTLRQVGSVNTVVNSEVYLQEALLPLVDGNGKFIVHADKIIVGRVIE